MIVEVELEPFHKTIFSKYIPWFGKTEGEVIKNLALRWVEAHGAEPSTVEMLKICEDKKEHK